MSSSRRVSRSKQDDGEFLLECKAAFLSVYDDIGDRIGSKKDLLTGLSCLYSKSYKLLDSFLFLL